jgi:hypothetical protein
MPAGRSYDRSVDERAEATTSAPFRLLRDWWWVVLPAVVALSIGISSFGGAHRPDANVPRAVVATQAPSGIFQTVVPLDAGHRLAVGHRRSHAPFRDCVVSHENLTTRQAQRTCLTEAHLGLSTPFS